MDYFVKLPGVRDVIGKGETKSSVRLENGMAADIRGRLYSRNNIPMHCTILPEAKSTICYAAPCEGTGIKDERIRIVSRGESEGIFLVKMNGEVFQALGMPYIIPELRENTGEIEAALKHSLPDSVMEEDIKGIFHVHSNHSDGVNSIEELAAAAKGLGYQYIGLLITANRLFMPMV